MDRWLMNHHTSVSFDTLSDVSDVEAPPFIDDAYLWDSFDITVRLDDAGDQPTDEVVLGQLTNQYNRLNDQRHYYATRNGTRQNAIMKELWRSGIRFDSVNEIY
jgi:hypothetical protein